MILAHFDAQDYDIDRRMFQALMNDYQITAYSVRKELPAVITAFDIIFLDFGGTPHDEYPNWINKIGISNEITRTMYLMWVYFLGIARFSFIGSHSRIAAVQQAHPQNPLPQMNGPKIFAIM